MRFPEFRLERFFARHEFSAPHLLCCSDCETVSVAEVLALEPGATERFLELRLGYTDSRGGAPLRAAIAGLYAAQDPESILVHTGAEEAIFGFMHAALEPGDNVIVQTPCYQSLFDLPKALGCTVTPWEGRPENGFVPDPDELRRSLTKTTRAVVVNFPNNPTGALPSRAFFEALVALAAERGLILFSDEVYRGLEYDPRLRLPAACDLYENAVSLGVTSKSWGLAGLRIGWVATRNQDLLARMAAFKDYTTICNSAPSEFLAELAIRLGAPLLSRNRDLVRANLETLDAFFSRHEERISWPRPQAGPIAFPGLLQERDADAFCAKALRAKGVLLAAASHFNHGGPHFRIGFGRADFPRALAAFEDFLGA